MTTPGRRLAEAIAAKDAEALGELLSPEVDFRALTPSRSWQAATPAEVAEIAFGSWFEDGDRIDELVDVTEGSAVEDTAHVSYRLAVTTDGTPYTVEQQAYYRTDDGAISYLRILCSGFRPTG